MSKFKVGDKVRILDGSKIENYTGNRSNIGLHGMGKYVGSIQTIKSVDEDWPDGKVSYRMKGIIYNWDERGLEPVSEREEKQKIVITTHGRITKARLYDDEKLVRQAVARCAPGDKFDFNVGANLAFTRLMGTSPVATSLDWDKFAHGKLQVKVSRKTYDAFMKQCEQRGFTWHDGEKINPWELYDEMPSFLKAVAEAISGVLGEHIYISVVGGKLKWSENRDEDLEEYEFI